MTQQPNQPSEVMPGTLAVSVDKLSFRYRSLDDEPASKSTGTSGAELPSQPHAIEDISFSLPAGKLMLIAGPSGCGKSTLLKCLNGLIPNSYKEHSPVKSSFTGTRLRVSHYVILHN